MCNGCKLGGLRIDSLTYANVSVNTTIRGDRRCEYEKQLRCGNPDLILYIQVLIRHKEKGRSLAILIPIIDSLHSHVQVRLCCLLMQFDRFTCSRPRLYEPVKRFPVWYAINNKFSPVVRISLHDCCLDNADAI